MSRNSSTVYDVIVIGGGAAGMMAAGRAVSRGRRVLILEKNTVLGKKLGITGGGRCNITNAEFDTRALLKKYGAAGEFLHSPFSQFSVTDTFRFFTDRGLPLVVEDRKRVFPETQRAADVVQLMMSCIENKRTTIVCRAIVASLQLREEGGYTVVTQDGGTYSAPSVIVATGGLSHAYTGSTGDAFLWLKRLGYRVHGPTPDLVPLTVLDEWIRQLSGKVLRDIGITFADGWGNILRKRGDVLCTHFGMSGPLIINSSREVKQMLHAGPVTITVNLFPGDSLSDVDQKFVTHFTQHKNKSLRNGLRDFLPPGTIDVVLVQSGVSPDTKIHSVTRDERVQIVQTAQKLTATVTGTEGFERSIVSDGGVDLTQIDTRTMCSRIHPGLYFVGDILHINRPSGGFSLQLCWTTGWVAGSNA